MRASMALLQRACRITLFTRPNCALCDNAKTVLGEVWDQKPFEYQEIEILNAGREKWREMYEFDTPVMHIQKTKGTTFESAVEASQKLMHRFKEAEILKVMEAVEAK